MKDIWVFSPRLMENGTNKVNSATSKANRVLGLMKNTLSSRLDYIARIIHTKFVRPHIELVLSV